MQHLSQGAARNGQPMVHPSAPEQRPPSGSPDPYGMSLHQAILQVIASSTHRISTDVLSSQTHHRPIKKAIRKATPRTLG